MGLVPIIGIDAVMERVSEASVADAIGLSNRQDLRAFLLEVERDEELGMWTLERSGKSLGLAFHVRYDGPPYLHFAADPPLGLDVTLDALTALIHAHFQQTQEPHLFVFLPRPVDQGVCDGLADLGFDSLDELPIIDNGLTRAFVLERYTYDAYFSTQEDESEFSEL